MLVSSKIEYCPNDPFCLRRDGVECPLTSSEVLNRLYPSRNYGFLGGLCLARDRCSFVNPSGERVLFSTFRRIFGEEMSPAKYLHAIGTLPSGQVKNFLNACRACVDVPETVRVAVIGSKSAEGGGLWHRYFAMYLALYSRNVMVDFYDYSERQDAWTRSDDRNFISCEWIPEPITEERLRQENYDCVVDDVWTYEFGPGWHAIAPAFSHKGTHEVTETFQPFLHSTETRAFSHPPRKEQVSPCPCMLCTTICQCVRTYQDFLLIRSLCTRLGHRTYCLEASFVNELTKVYEMHRRLVMKGESIVSESNYRFVMAVSEELPLDVNGLRVVVDTGEQPKFIPLSRKQVKAKIMPEQESFEWLGGKAIQFAGVPSTILGGTNFKTVPRETGSFDYDVVFVSSTDVWRQHYGAPVVYAPSPPDVAKKEFPDWTSTGRTLKNFYEYVRQSVVSNKQEVPVEMRPHQRLKMNLGPPVGVFPFLDVTEVGSYLDPYPSVPDFVEKKNYYTLRSAPPYLVLSPFDPRQWKMSIWVTGSKWGPYRQDPVGIKGESMWLMYGAVSFPVDMSMEEVKSLEEKISGGAQEELRAVYLKEKKYSPHIRFKTMYGVLTLAQWVTKQQEFYFRDKRLCRSRNGHPTSFLSFDVPGIKDISWRFSKGLMTLEEFLRNRESEYALKDSLSFLY